jgi:hypothetical protein
LQVRNVVTSELKAAFASCGFSAYPASAAFRTWKVRLRAAAPYFAICHLYFAIRHSPYA